MTELNYLKYNWGWSCDSFLLQSLGRWSLRCINDPIFDAFNGFTTFKHEISLITLSIVGQCWESPPIPALTIRKFNNSKADTRIYQVQSIMQAYTEELNDNPYLIDEITTFAKELRLPSMENCWQSLIESKRVDGMSLRDGVLFLLSAESE